MNCSWNNRTTILAVYASQLKHITLEHENADISPRRFNVESDNFTFKCRMMVGDEELYAGMKGKFLYDRTQVARMYCGGNSGE